MATVSASLIGTTVPKLVQVVVAGLTVGDEYVVTGRWSGGLWQVRAGAGVAAASQVVLSDNQTPVNVPITYQVSVNGGLPVESAPITVDYAGRYVMQSLDGRSAAAFWLLENGLPRESGTRVATFQIPGRTRPAIRYDVVGGESGSYVVQTAGSQTASLQALVEAGAPVLFRTDGAVRDLGAVEIVVLTSASRVATRRAVESGEARDWSLSFEVIDDPEPNAVVVTSTWDDFDAAYAVPDTVTRTNRMLNPIGGSVPSTSGWNGVRGTLSLGAGFLRLTVTNASSTQYIVTPTSSADSLRVPVSAGEQIAVAGQARSSSSVSMRMHLQFRDSAGTLLGSQIDGAAVATTSSGWTDLPAVSGTAPAGTAYAVVLMATTAAAALNVTLDFRQVIMEAGSSVGDYFDGDTTDTATERYDWTGTAHASTSTLTRVSNTWNVFDTEWTGSTWDTFDLEDWATRADSA